VGYNIDALTPRIFNALMFDGLQGSYRRTKEAGTAGDDLQGAMEAKAGGQR